MSAPEQAILSGAPPIADALDTAVEDAVREHSRAIYRIAFSVLRNHHDAEGATQETFVRLLRYCTHNRIDSVRDLRAWLARGLARGDGNCSGTGFSGVPPTAPCAGFGGGVAQTHCYDGIRERTRAPDASIRMACCGKSRSRFDFTRDAGRGLPPRYSLPSVEPGAASHAVRTTSGRVSVTSAAHGRGRASAELRRATPRRSLVHVPR